MVLVLLIMALAIDVSWQEHTTEQSLDEILDELLEESVLSTFSDKNGNNSRILYVKPNNSNKRNSDTKQQTTEQSIHNESFEVTAVLSSEIKNNSEILNDMANNLYKQSLSSRRSDQPTSNEYEDLEDLNNRINNIKLNQNNPEDDIDDIQVGHKNFNIEKEQDTFPHYHNNDIDEYHESHTKNVEFSSQGRPLFEDIPDNFLKRTTKVESNLIHEYPDIIINKITHETFERQNEQKENTTNIQSDARVDLNKETRKEVAAKALDSLVKLLLSKAPIEDSNQNIQTELEKNDDSNTLSKSGKYLENQDNNAFLSSTHIHNAYHSHVVNNVPLAYRGLTPSRKMLLRKLPEGYQDLHHVINRPRSAYLDTNMQLNRWGGNAGQNSIMSISRGHNLNHVHFIPRPLRVVPRIVYQPIYQRRRCC